MQSQHLGGAEGLKSKASLGTLATLYFTIKRSKDSRHCSTPLYSQQLEGRDKRSARTTERPCLTVKNTGRPRRLVRNTALAN